MGQPSYFYKHVARNDITYPKPPKPLDDPAVAVLLPPNSPPPLVVPVPNPLRFWFAPNGVVFEVGDPKPVRIG